MATTSSQNTPLLTRLVPLRPSLQLITSGSEEQGGARLAHTHRLMG